MRSISRWCGSEYRLQHLVLSHAVMKAVMVQWVGWIKDYDGGTLMECVINPRLPYTDFPGLVERQREALDRHIRTLSKSHVVYPGINSFGEGRIDVSSIPGAWTILYS